MPTNNLSAGSSITLADVRSKTDPIRNYNFELIINNIPVANGDPTALKILLLDAAAPGFGVETFPSGHAGFVLKHPGRQTYPRILQAVYEENNQVYVTSVIRQWIDLLYNPINAVSVEAKTTASFFYLNLKRQPVAEISLVGLFPEFLGDTQFSGQASSSNVPIPVQFSYDLHLLSSGGVTSL